MIWFIIGVAVGLNVALGLFYILFWPVIGCPSEPADTDRKLP